MDVVKWSRSGAPASKIDEPPSRSIIYSSLEENFAKCARKSAKILQSDMQEILKNNSII